MSVVFKPTKMSDEKSKELTSLLFVHLAQTEQLDDVTITEHVSLFPTWSSKWTGKKGVIVSDEGVLYRSIHDVTNVGQNTKPSQTPSMWTRIGNPADEYPQWVQPIGVHDAYNEGDKVTHNSRKWKSTVSANVWQPGVYGWEEVV